MLDESLVNSLPDSSGVYIFRDKDKNIIYVGKAKNIKERVKSYTREKERDLKTNRLVESIEDVEIVLTENEKEAFLLENNLIKENRPKYNINLKDDKTYISLKLTVKDRFPALYPTRKIEEDGALYFGPYPNVRDVRDVLNLIHDIYPIRRCKDTVFKRRKRPCILYEIKKCLGPCGGNIEEAFYREVVNELLGFLSGKDGEVLKGLESKINAASRIWNFEEAKRLKERYLAIKGMVEKQRVHQHFGKNRDVWAFLENKNRVKIVLLTFRRGVLISKKVFRESLMSFDFEGAISTFLYQYYCMKPIPDEIIVSEDLEDFHHLERYLREDRRRDVRILGPQNRDVKEMIKLAIENLHEPEEKSLNLLFKETLNLKKIPERIEVYDISHIHGENPTGVMVAFESFKPKKEDYRVFHIRYASFADDVGAMAEVMDRRVSNESLGPLPDLIVIDGGKGQLSAVLRILKNRKIEADAIGIAKGEKRTGMEDVIYLPNRKNPLVLPRASSVFKQLVSMRDEAHRFAVSSHRRWRRKDGLK